MPPLWEQLPCPGYQPGTPLQQMDPAGRRPRSILVRKLQNNTEARLFHPGRIEKMKLLLCQVSRGVEPLRSSAYCPSYGVRVPPEILRGSSQAGGAGVVCRWSTPQQASRMGRPRIRCLVV